MLGGCAGVRLEHASTTGAVYIEDQRGLVPGCLVAQLVGISLAMAAKVRRHWFNPCRLGSRGHLGANFSLYSGRSSILTSFRKETI